ncbi:hypothetical protein WG908_14340 [Sphingobium sp. AN641]|uniref:hypothetical protein n=1 Tax=Sphingobium sp. AN641 TaxID=3133443 RepID=UPI0030BD3D70
MQDDDIDALIGQMFALLTTKFEDGVGLAVEGQVPRPGQIPELVGRVRALAHDAIALCDAIAVADASRG